MSYIKNKIIFFLLIVFIILNIIYVNNFGLSFSSKQEEWGAYGSYIGGVFSPIISLFALLYLIKTYTTQKSELVSVKKSLSTQNFENHFFKLLDRFLDEVKNLKYLDVNGGQIFEKIIEYNDINLTSIDNISEFKNYYFSHLDYPKHYFDYVFTILEHIDSYSSEIDTKKYFQIFLLNLSQLELTYIAYHALALTDDTFKNLLDRYDILKKLDLEGSEINIKLLSNYGSLKEKINKLSNQK